MTKTFSCSTGLAFDLVFLDMIGLSVGKHYLVTQSYHEDGIFFSFTFYSSPVCDK